MPAFIDTNILIYAVGLHPEAATKIAIAQDILRRDDCVLSVQVLQEFHSQAVRTSRAVKLSSEQALNFLTEWQRFPVQDVTRAIFEDGVALHRRYKLSYWDGAIIAAARAQGCDTLYSEDMAHGQVVEGVRIVDPFR